MEIIVFKKVYRDGHCILLDIQASNAPLVYIDKKLNDLPQINIENNNYENHIDKLYVNRFKGIFAEWESKEITYKETNTESDIYYGFIIKSIEKKNGDVIYECEYAGKKITHKGIVSRMNWQKALFEEWKEKYNLKL